MSLTRCGPHDSTITRSSGRGGVDVGGVAEGKRRRWQCSLFHISSAVDFFHQPPHQHTPNHSLNPPFFFAFTCLMWNVGGDVQQTLNAVLKWMLRRMRATHGAQSLYIFTAQQIHRLSLSRAADYESTWQNKSSIIIQKNTEGSVTKRNRLENMKCSSIFCAIEKRLKTNYIANILILSGVCMTFTCINSKRQ